MTASSGWRRRRTRLFEVRYRLGNGRRGNLPAGAITPRRPVVRLHRGGAESVAGRRRPGSGALDDVKQLAPEAFRAVTYRAVRPEDYAEAAERLAWVPRAGAAFRSTGSWVSAFVTADPRDPVDFSDVQRVAVVDHLDRFRQTGREAHLLDPRYADLDLDRHLCAVPSSYSGDVLRRCRRRSSAGSASAASGLLPARPLTFGTPLRRAALEAAVQRVAGVRAVEDMRSGGAAGSTGAR